MALRTLIATWAIALVVTIVAVAISIAWIDVPVVRFFGSNLNQYKAIGKGLGSAVLIGGELVVAIAIALRRLSHGSVPDFQKGVLIAIIASLCTYAVNDVVLKFAFGMPTPADFLTAGAPHAFVFAHGAQYSSFPSGHMVLATSFATALGRLQPVFKRALAIVLAIAAAALIAGEWHFVSDVIAGTFVGYIGGLMTAEIWLAHLGRIAAQGENKVTRPP